MIPRGMSLIECLVGLAIAGMVAAIAMAALSMSGIVTERQLADGRERDAAWLALAAISRDLVAAPTWNGCLGTDSCKGHTTHRPSTALVAGSVRWSADGDLWRCDGGHPCDKYLEGIASAMFLADIPSAIDGDVTRTWLSERHGDGADAVEVSLWMKDGRYARTTSRPGHAR
ncbi:PulJ/GspJ family protein [Luteibacter sp. NPDC031894]|uniref:PulJ/GspJ family protein n=1 Tax=Luteibacter sp. NPDC031894 TaxID=3390572 RepID=UPI003D061889